MIKLYINNQEEKEKGIMNTKNLKTLEFDKICAMLAELSGIIGVSNTLKILIDSSKL